MDVGRRHLGYEMIESIIPSKTSGVEDNNKLHYFKLSVVIGCEISQYRIHTILFPGKQFVPNWKINKTIRLNITDWVTDEANLFADSSVDDTVVLSTGYSSLEQLTYILDTPTMTPSACQSCPTGETTYARSQFDRLSFL